MRRQFLLASVVLVVLVVPAVASAATRYASPNGSSSASCTAAAPCDLVTAVNGDGLNNNPTAGDEVVITPGQYGQLGNGIHTRLDPAVQENIHGAAGQPPPVLQLDAAPSGQVRSVIVLDQPDDRLADVDINTPYSGFEVPNGTVDGVFARSFSDVGDHACGLAQSITNTVCFRDGQGGGSAFRAAFSGCAANTSIALRNVTLEAPQGTGADVSAFGATCNPTVTISNAIIRGSPATQLDPAQDLLAYSSGGGGSVSVVLDHSDYTQTNDGSGGTTTPAGTGTNITADPALANPTGGDFHETAASPTIDAGITSPLNGLLDFDGQSRTSAGKTDIGADQFMLLPAVRSPGVRSVSTSAATVSGKVNPNHGDTTYSFRYGTTSATTRTTKAGSIAGGRADVPVSARLTGLPAGRRIYWRLVASNGAGKTTGTLQQFVTKARPALSRLKLAKRKFPAAKGGSLSYRDSQRARTKLTIYRAVRRNGHKTYVLVKTLTHSDRVGTNKVRLKGGWLTTGSYRLEAQAHNANGTSRTLKTKFRAT